LREFRSVRRPTAGGGRTAVVSQLREVGGRLRCKIGIHRYRENWDYELPPHLKECGVCGKRAVSGWPERALPSAREAFGTRLREPWPKG
jgi:hypothetical protein